MTGVKAPAIKVRAATDARNGNETGFHPPFTLARAVRAADRRAAVIELHQAGWRQQAIADRLGISQPRVSDILRAARKNGDLA